MRLKCVNMEKVPGAMLLHEAPGCINDLRGDDGHMATV